MSEDRQVLLRRIEDALVRMRVERRGFGRPGGPPEPPFGPRHHGGPHGRGHERRGRGGPDRDGDDRRGGRRGGPRGMALMRLLETLSTQPRSITEVAELIGVDQPRASRLVAAAVEHDLARRVVDPADARRAIVEITTAGRSRLEAVRQHRRGEVESATRDFSIAELQTFADLLERFTAGFAHGPDPD